MNKSCRNCMHWGIDNTQEERATARWLPCEIPLPEYDRDVREWVWDGSLAPPRLRWAATGEFIRSGGTKLGSHAEYLCSNHARR
jgi:hypothetical protein